jgi:hypothetical protein
LATNFNIQTGHNYLVNRVVIKLNVYSKLKLKLLLLKMFKSTF